MPRRIRLLLALGAIAIAVGLGTQAVSPQTGPRLLPPDLVPQAPADLDVRAVQDGGRTLYRLGFRSAGDNLGPGPLVMRAEADLRRPGELVTTQLVRRVGGSAQARPLMVRLTYVTSPDHSHFHYPAFMRYELRDPRTGRRIGRDRKTGFCLGDRYEMSARVRRKPRRAKYTGDCARDRPDVQELEQGISVGYGDDYDPHLEGQSIDVTDVPTGRYLLVHTVNPDRTFTERTRRNNQSSALIRIARRRGAARPHVTLLRQCPRRSTCG
jgi:hypothetical protein